VDWPYRARINSYWTYRARGNWTNRAYRTNRSSGCGIYRYRTDRMDRTRGNWANRTDWAGWYRTYRTDWARRSRLYGYWSYWLDWTDRMDRTSLNSYWTYGMDRLSRTHRTYGSSRRINLLAKFLGNSHRIFIKRCRR